MGWHKDPSYANGGRWRCRIQRKKWDAERWQRYEEHMPFEVRARKCMSAKLATRHHRGIARRAATPVSPLMADALRAVKRGRKQSGEVPDQG